MKSDVIYIDSNGKGFKNAIEQSGKTAAFAGLNESQSLDLQLLTEEMLSLVRSVTGEVEASFWIESEGREIELHMTTKTVMDKEKRYELIQSSTSRKNEAASGFLGKLRNALEDAMVSDVDSQTYDLPMDVLSDVSSAGVETAEWDGYERSILQSVADQVKVGIRGGVVDVTICKYFGE